MALLGLPNNPQQLIQSAFNDDSLLTHYPLQLRAVTSLLQMARDLMRAGQFSSSTAASLGNDLHITDVLRMMQSLFIS
jgi:hypothetical protein